MNTNINYKNTKSDYMPDVLYPFPILWSFNAWKVNYPSTGWYKYYHFEQQDSSRMMRELKFVIRVSLK